MSIPLLALGPHIFQITELNFQKFKRATKVKIPAISRFGARPGRQFTGFGEDSINIDGLLFPEEFNDRTQYEALRITQAAAKPIILMGWAVGNAGAAQLFGQVVILDIDDTQSLIGRTGQGRRIEYSILLAPYPGDGKPIGLFSSELVR